MADWNPTQYLMFASERAQPAIDLINRLPVSDPRVVVDLGCGPGNSTALLRQRFPNADLCGIDSSPAMIERAIASGVAARFEVADVTHWQPESDVDLLFSNALFQWLPDHLEILQRILKSLSPGAVLAVQMPDNLDEPSHRAMATVASRANWRELMLGVAVRQPLHRPSDYHAAFMPLSKDFAVWRTTYQHTLDNHRAIAEMFASTGLKPYLDILSMQQRSAFLEEYVLEIAPYYQPLNNGRLLFPFPRLFLMAIRGDS